MIMTFSNMLFFIRLDFRKCYNVPALTTINTELLTIQNFVTKTEQQSTYLGPLKFNSLKNSTFLVSFQN